MTDDVVAELDDWLAREATTLKHYPADDVDTELLQRARDEIAALRSARNECERQFQEQVAEVSRLLCQLEAVKGIAGNERKLSEAIIQQARDAALEEAAGACERRRDETGPQEAYAVLDVQSYTSACSGCAADIRALKGKH